MSHILQCVWPIVDDTYTRTQLIAEATPQLEDLADQAHAVITGPPFWLIQDAADVPGWGGYAPGSVLVARVPAEPAHLGYIDGEVVDGPDPAAIERLIAGNPPEHIRPGERSAAMVAMATRGTGAEIAAVASRFGVKVEAVERAIGRNRRHQRDLVAA